MNTIIITSAITIVLCSIAFVTQAQTFSEWWRQKKTKMKYLKKQITALEMLKHTLEQGNEDAEAGIDSEEVNMMLEYKMTDVYLTSLGEVKPDFRFNGSVMSSYSMAKVHAEMAKEDLAAYSKSPWLTASEVGTIKFELRLMKDDMEQTMRNLRLLVTDGKVEMEDGDRWEMISGIEDHVELIGRFMLMMTTQIDALIETRQQQAANDEYLKNNIP